MDKSYSSKVKKSFIDDKSENKIEPWLKIEIEKPINWKTHKITNPKTTINHVFFIKLFENPPEKRSLIMTTQVTETSIFCMRKYIIDSWMKCVAVSLNIFHWTEIRTILSNKTPWQQAKWQHASHYDALFRRKGCKGDWKQQKLITTETKGSSEIWIFIS